MLDTDTKRRIDTARDILVGKVPDPKSQVEQITIALIYKFMDDMDKESIEMGGKSKFFSGEYQRYSWTKIFDPKMGSYELVNTYGDAIQKMNQNPKIPQLFRDIFKNAYLPYRDPETLKSFLKIIDEFKYDHSERLGDAFEYLLSILGSQGEAGQFRTPRHIIDFMVEIVDPKKDDTILDPACGTAGFLISAYKHILKHNSKDFNPDKDLKAFELQGVKPEEITVNNIKYKGDKLTSDDRERLAKNIIGYDISPDMVRLSLVNMYLHGFSNPPISEYDTLTSEDKWNEYADVIMANPPFMSPKGGIRPHKRFSIESNRSEVLFVDYIAEHLTPQGRAAVIVPEGIIFQSQGSHKSLRQILIEKNYLVGVISLPAGVFNPYSGVKTSILWLDKTLAKKTDKIIFVKIENDGFDLGAQRRSISQNDLPDAFNALQTYKKSLQGNELFDANKYRNVIVAKKEQINEANDFNLTYERYKPVTISTNIKWQMMELKEICEISTGNTAPQNAKLFENGKYPFYRTSDVGSVHLSGSLTQVNDWLNDEGIKGLKLFKKGAILFPKSGASTFLNHRVIMGLDGYVSSHLATIWANPEKVLNKYLYYLLIGIDAKSLTADQNYPSLKTSNIGKIVIPLPPLEIQKQIVAEIDGYQKIIDGARQIVDNWRPSIKIDSKWEMVELGTVADVIAGQSPEGKFYNESGEGMAFYQGKTEFGEMFLDIPRVWTTQITRIAEKDDILMSVRAPVGPVNIATQKICIGRGLSAIRATKIDRLLLFYYLKSIETSISGNGGAVFDSINKEGIQQIKIPFPPEKEQKQIVAQIEEEQKVVEGNRKLMELYQSKIKSKIAEVWGE